MSTEPRQPWRPDIRKPPAEITLQDVVRAILEEYQQRGERVVREGVAEPLEVHELFVGDATAALVDHEKLTNLFVLRLDPAGQSVITLGYPIALAGNTEDQISDFIAASLMAIGESMAEGDREIADACGNCAVCVASREAEVAEFAAEVERTLGGDSPEKE